MNTLYILHKKNYHKLIQNGGNMLSTIKSKLNEPSIEINNISYNINIKLVSDNIIEIILNITDSIQLYIFVHKYCINTQYIVYDIKKYIDDDIIDDDIINNILKYILVSLNIPYAINETDNNVFIINNEHDKYNIYNAIINQSDEKKRNCYK